MQHALAYLDEHAPLRSGERATHFRFWMAADTYQGVSAFQSQNFLKIAQHYLTTPKLAFTFFPCADTEFWAPFCGYAELLHTPEAGYDVGGHSFGVFTHDWRALPWMQWLDLLAAREMATSDTPSAPVVSEQPLVVLNEVAFVDAVRDAFRHYARPATLADHPLLNTRIVTDAVGANADAADRIEALRHLLAEAAKTLEATPRDERLYRGLYRMYLHPSGSQEQVAEMLEVPLSTFRRHLKKATGRVAEILWQRELNA